RRAIRGVVLERSLGRCCSTTSGALARLPARGCANRQDGAPLADRAGTTARLGGVVPRLRRLRPPVDARVRAAGGASVSRGGGRGGAPHELDRRLGYVLAVLRSRRSGLCAPRPLPGDRGGRVAEARSR